MAEATNKPEMMCGLHYFNPVQIMKLVEIVSTEHTTPEVTAAVTEFVKKTGKVYTVTQDQ